MKLTGALARSARRHERRPQPIPGVRRTSVRGERGIGLMWAVLTDRPGKAIATFYATACGVPRVLWAPLVCGAGWPSSAADSAFGACKHQSGYVAVLVTRGELFANRKGDRRGLKSA